MAQFVYRANLSAKTFPFLSENWGRSVIMPGPDNTYNFKVASPEDQDKDAGIPQIYYCHNVLPFGQGFQTIGYLPIVSPVPGKSFTTQFLLRDGADNKAYLGITTSGEWLINTGGLWLSKGTYGTQVTTAYVSGITYIWVSGVGCYKYDFGTSAFVSVTLTGLTIAGILGIAPSFGYLIAWTKNSVAWSSTIDPTDFTPSLTTGAGGGGVEGAKGSITFCLPHTLGFMVYTTSNVVVAMYSGNARYPFQFREIVNSGGCASQELISYDANTGNHYAYTTSGMQLISTQAGQTVFPELTDFISGQLFEDFDESTLTFSSAALTAAMAKKLTVVADRYIVLSYGISSLTHALVYDMIQKRWGKLKIPHVDCFEFQLTNPGVFEIPKQSLAFLQADGTIKIASFSLTASSASGCILLGKYQYVRARLLQLDQIDIENVHSSNFSLKVLTALDGKNGVFTTPTAGPGSVGLQRSYYTRAIGMNHSILCLGNFNLASLVLTFNVHGKR